MTRLLILLVSISSAVSARIPQSAKAADDVPPIITLIEPTNARRIP